MVDMTREGAVYTGEFFLPQPFDHVRFDPSTAPCEFACASLEISGIAGATRSAAPDAVKPKASAMSSLLRRASGVWHRVRASGPLIPGPARPPGRKERVLSGIDRSGFGIEIGPSHDPLAPKGEGFKVHVVDHASREELLEKYRGHPIPLDRIEEVDFVWHGESYLELTGKPKFYDWIIASHLIEHTPVTGSYPWGQGPYLLAATLRAEEDT